MKHPIKLPKLIQAGIIDITILGGPLEWDRYIVKKTCCRVVSFGSDGEATFDLTYDERLGYGLRVSSGRERNHSTTNTILTTLDIVKRVYKSRFVLRVSRFFKAIASPSTSSYW
jgi:hypothetical protein